MAKPTTKIITVQAEIRRANAKLGVVSIERQYIQWKPAGKSKWLWASWNEFGSWIKELNKNRP